MAAIIKTGLKYLRPPTPSLRVMSKDDTTIRLNPFVNCSNTNVVTIFSLKLQQWS